MALPTMLAGIGAPTAGLAQPDSSGTQFEVWLYQCTGLTSTYTRTLLATYKGEVEEVAWTYDRVGGPDSATVKLSGTVASLDTAVQNEYEVEIRLADSVWYRGRLTAYAYESDSAGNVKNVLTVEGYQTKLAEITFTASYTAQTVKVIVQSILDSYVTPACRITYSASNIVGAYTVNSISFVNATVLDALRTLAALQGSTEFGVTESTPPHVYFLAESTTASESAYVLVQGQTPSVSVTGSFETAWNQIKVVGGYTDGAVVSGTGNDTTAQGSYGTRSRVVVEPSLLNAADCQRLGNNLATIYANGLGYLTGMIQGPSTRVEPDRTQAGGSYSGAGKATFWSGSDKQSELWSRVSYAYRKGSPQNFMALVEAGGPATDMVQYVRRLDQQLRALASLAQQTSELTDVGRVKARKNSAGSTFGPRARLNFIEGSGVTITVADDATNDEIDVTISASAGSSKWDETGGVLTPLTVTNTVNISGPARFAGTFDTTFAGVDVNDWSPAGLTTGFVARMDAGPAAMSITGIDSSVFGAIDGTILCLMNVGSENITLANENAGSLSANRFALPGQADMVLMRYSGLIVRYSGSNTKWEAVSEKAIHVSATDRILGRSSAGAGIVQEITCTAAGRALLDDANAAAQRATLDVPSNSEAILDTIVDAKGDLIAGTAADTVARLAVGADGTILVADSGEATGLKWSATSTVNSRVAVSKNSGATIGTRRRINFIEGTDVSITVADDSTNEEVDVTIGLPSTLTVNARVAVNKNSGATVGTRRRINFIEGTDVSITVADDSTNEEVDVTIALPSTLTVNARVAVNKNSGATVGTRRRINFIEGSGITLTVADDATNEEVDVTIASTGASATHDILSATHSDSAAAAVARGAIIVGNSTPAWSRLTIGSAGKILRSDGTDLVYSTATFPADTTRGAVLVASASSTWAALAVGAAATFLRSDGTDATWTAIAAGDLPSTLTSNARIAVSKNSGATVGTRRRINFIEGTDVSITVADDSTNEEVDVTIGLPSTLTVNARVAVNKNSGATVGTRRRINFIEGSNVTLTVTDDPTNEEVDVTIASTVSGGLDINGLTAADPALGDEIPIYDISASANRKITFEEIGFLTRFHMGGRLTPESGVSVPTGDNVAVATLYYTPHLDTVVTLYDGTRWKAYTFAEISLSLASILDTKNYDVFLYDNAGTLTLELSAAWTDNETRADALVTQDGVYVKSGATTRRWVGTIRASGDLVTQDDTARRFVWNLYNQVARFMKVVEGTDSWNYSTASYRSANGSDTNRVQAVCGLASTIHLDLRTLFSSTLQNGSTVAIGEDSTTTQVAGQLITRSVSQASGFATVLALLDKSMALGFHYYQWLEYGAGSGTQTWYGDNADATIMSNGMSGWIMG